jgi:hypothetical protein
MIYRVTVHLWPNWTVGLRVSKGNCETPVRSAADADAELEALRRC